MTPSSAVFQLLLPTQKRYKCEIWCNFHHLVAQTAISLRYGGCYISASMTTLSFVHTFRYMFEIISISCTMPSNFIYVILISLHFVYVLLFALFKSNLLQHKILAHESLRGSFNDYQRNRLVWGNPRLFLQNNGIFTF